VVAVLALDDVLALVSSLDFGLSSPVLTVTVHLPPLQVPLCPSSEQSVYSQSAAMTPTSS